MKRLGRVVELQREVQELYQSYQVLSVRENVVQLFSGYFLDIFDGYEIVDFDEDYDELVAYCDGIRFITLVDKNNYTKKRSGSYDIFKLVFSSNSDNSSYLNIQEDG